MKRVVVFLRSLSNKVYKALAHIQVCKAKSCDAAERWAQINIAALTLVANKSPAPNFAQQVLVQKVER